MESRKEMPIFVRVDEYRDILEIIDLIKSKISEAKAVIGKINDIRNEEDSEFDVWKNELAEVERKVNFIDKSLFEPENY